MRSRLSEISSILYGKSPAEVADGDGDFPIIGTGGEYGRAFTPMFETGVVVPRKGTLGNPQLVQEPFWATDTTFAVLPTKETDIRWLYYCLLNYDLAKLNEATGVPSISRDWLAKIEFLNPGFRKQQKIARILKTIDLAIEQTEALIEKYQKIKAGLMHDLFSRGIGSDGQLRPPREQAPELYRETPIGWIPKEWGTRSILELVELPSGQVNPLLHPYIDMTLIAPDHIEKETGRLLFKETAREQGAISGKYTFNRGDIIYSKIRPYLRKAILSDFEGICSADMYPLRVKSGNDPLFIFGIILGDQFSRYAESVSMRSGFPKINRSELSGFSCGVPPTREQNKIAHVINGIEAKIRRNEELFQKLRKQKSGLMHDLLTGKVPVQVEPEAEAEAVNA